MEEQPKFLVANDTYLKSGIHIGTKFRTKYMEQFIYKTRPDGLSVLNLQKIDERIRVCTKFLSQYAPEDILIVSRRENSWKPVKLLGKLTGMKVFAGRYPPGILTNSNLESYIEPKVLLVTDSWPDRNAVKDAVNIGIPVIALCDTNNQSNNIDLVVPCNNKGKKSLGLFFWILAREYLTNRGLIKKPEDMKEPVEDFTEE
ncbi:MAG: 30S ribosomal protein S2 [Candidatus Woesearchaeota archaeon]|jgi:small subunit ribosomal protein S2|nr:30S ribosomal protein S2 [Candidatus Woesearchaeota archaeon]MDP7506190.1 30S ribosomal protein S2 [Candidatus Woesearchaeota archaeon]MDP7610625.1 30S ribosomal protein S2 [Candidatus Woesearchaeota archaeon]|tara:strand:- start:441 stop:1043 length:603 start_codon:yes stop_codon:yes gene_type:complete